MSGTAGSSNQPERLTRSRTSTGAPQVGQLTRSAAWLEVRHQRQVYVDWANAPGQSVWWWTYIDWIPTLPGPVIRARFMPWPPKSPEVSFCVSTFRVTEASL